MRNYFILLVMVVMVLLLAQPAVRGASDSGPSRTYTGTYGTVSVQPRWALDPDGKPSGVIEYVLSWVCSVSGRVNVAVPGVAGKVEKVKIVPATGAIKPLALYDVTLLDEDGDDLLVRQGANLSQTASKKFNMVTTSSLSALRPDCLAGGPLTLTVDNAGTSSQGLMRIVVTR